MRLEINHLWQWENLSGTKARKINLQIMEYAFATPFLFPKKLTSSNMILQNKSNNEL